MKISSSGTSSKKITKNNAKEKYYCYTVTRHSYTIHCFLNKDGFLRCMGNNFPYLFQLNNLFN
jgi:hypothetical protein